jgi:hypothetical protein
MGSWYNRDPMKNYYLPALIALVVLILILAGVSRFARTQQPDSKTLPPTPTEKVQHSQAPTGESITPSPNQANITVTEPKSNDPVGRSFIVQGTARVFENSVSYRLRNQRTGSILNQGVTTADAPDVGQFGDYTITISIPENQQLANNDMLILEVYQASAKDGSDTDKVSVPVRFSDQ